MKIETTILSVAKSANINLKNNEIKELVPQIKEIVSYFNVLDSCKTKGIEPTVHPIKVENIFRADKSEPSLSKDLALKNSKYTKDGYIIGPKTK
tara:strand:+ start:136 stop:417 length:282 start_codon:yes stop_codon:yes gene_type:complete